jgi:general secretion pathway protein K
MIRRSGGPVGGVTLLFRDNRGFALILTILVVSLLVVLTLQFKTGMWAGLYASANLRDGIKLGSVARSGVNLALAVLSEDGASSISDSLKETWAQSKELSVNSVDLFEEGRLQVEISDLSGRIPINRLINENGATNEALRMLLTRFLSLESFGLELEAVENLIDAIKDWIDPDDEVTRFGAENGYYQSLDPPYACGNGPMDSLSQLRLVKGMTDALFFGSDDSGSGISNHLTVYGDGRININTADPLVLRALSDDIDADMVQDMMDYRLDEKNDLADPAWYRKIPGMGHLTIDPDLIKISSDYFEVQSAGMAGNMSRQVTAVVKRKDGSSVQIVAWKAE